MEDNMTIYDIFPEYDKYVKARGALKEIYPGDGTPSPYDIYEKVVNFYDLAEDTLFLVPPDHIEEMRRTLNHFKMVGEMVESWNKECPALKYYYRYEKFPDKHLKEKLLTMHPELIMD